MRKAKNLMAVRNSHSRQSSNSTFIDIFGTNYMVTVGRFATMANVRSIIGKARRGTIKLDPTKRLIYAHEDGTFEQVEL